jgi:hypothetical protein
MGKKGIEFGFGWMFAIVVGAIIIFLAVFAAMRFVDTQRGVQGAQTAQEIGILLSPIETSLEEDQTAKITTAVETRIFNKCSGAGVFGRQELSTSLRSNIGDEWDEPEASAKFNNKYVFSSNSVEGKEFDVISKPFELPFRVGNLIYIFSGKYCFINAPGFVEQDVRKWGIESINVTNKKEDCLPESTKVCFGGGGCDIDVFFDPGDAERGSVKRQFIDRVYYEGPALMYGAIFADPGIYECQVQRLMGRASEISLLYVKKGDFLSVRGCNSGLDSGLVQFASTTLSLNSSRQLGEVSMQADELERRNKLLTCELF